MATITSRYTTSYTDYEYTITNDPNDDRLMYDVRPQYTDSQNNNVESDPYYETIAFGRIEFSKTDNFAHDIHAKEIISSYSVNNYPNPFNPTTTISYQLPEKSFVTLKVYDILGKEVTTLVNETKSAGYHSVIFDAGHSERGRGMTSGVYIYTISANGIVQTKKMLLTK